jgi:succinyl-diaminopimelate desuccinylase
VPDLAEVQIDIRTIPGQSNDALCEEIESILGEGAEVSRIVDVDAVASDPGNTWIAEVYEICRRATERRIEPKGATYFTDASVLVPAMGDIPTLVLGPGEPTMAHKTDEYCFVPKIEEAVELYAAIARRWMGI